MKPRMVNIDRDTPMLLPPDLRDWVPEDDMVHFVIATVESLPLPSLHINRRGSGSEQYPPKMMLALLIYCYANSVFSSRRIERATYRDVSVRYLTADTHPDHDTICTFRRENFQAVSEAFLQVLHLARQMGVLKVGAVSVDGTHLKANASKARSLRYDRAVELDRLLQEEIAALMLKAEQTDNAETEDGQRLPATIASRHALLAKVQEARAALEARAKAKADAARAAHEQKMAQRQHDIEKGNKRRGKPPKPPKDDHAPQPDDRINLTDPESVTMRKSHSAAYQQSYNAQAAVDADGSMLILGTHVITTPAEFGQLEAGLTQIDASLGPVKAVLADAGYVKASSFQSLEQQGIDAYVAVTSRQNRVKRKFDLQPDPDKPERAISNPVIKAMYDKLNTKQGREMYRKRGQTVEPVFGIIKTAMKFTGFLLRGLAKVTGEWNLVSLSYNFKRLWNLKHAAAG